MTRLFPPIDHAHHAGRVVTFGTVLGLLAVLALPTGCRPVDGRAATTAASAAVAEDGAAAAALAARGSLHDLAGRWRDQDGAERTLASTAAPARVVAMVYTGCVHTCPLIVADMKRLEAALPAGRRGDVRFVLVSLDPARDTPERLREFAGHAQLDPARWTLLTGGDDDVLELAAALNVRYRQRPDGEFEHGNVLTVLDPAGAVAFQQVGLGDDATPLRAAVERLLP